MNFLQHRSRLHIRSQEYAILNHVLFLVIFQKNLFEKAQSYLKFNSYFLKFIFLTKNLVFRIGQKYAINTFIQYNFLLKDAMK